MSPEILLSGYDRQTQALVFRVYAAELPEVPRRQMHKTEHFAALELLSAALCRDFCIRHAVVHRKGMEKPRLLHDGLFMNLSHCKGFAVCAAGSVPLGIDAETPRSVSEQVLGKICTAEETDFILRQENREFAFSRIWTLKEAYAKYTGLGLREPFDRLCFSIGETIGFAHEAAESLLLIQLLQEERRVISLCLPGQDLQLEAETDYLTNLSN